MARENTIMLMVVSMKENGLKEKEMVKGNKFILMEVYQMEISTMENGLTILYMAKENTIMLMVISMKENG